MTEFFNERLKYSKSGKADWSRGIEWYSIPILEIVEIVGEKQAWYCPITNTIELA